jgi:fibronectin type 3 domain-containing protein
MKINPFIKIIFNLLLFILFTSACGRRGAILPPQTIVPEAITEIRAVVRNDGVFILWSPPEKNNDGSKLENLMGFKVLRSEIPPERVCDSCVEIFEPLFDVLYTLPVESEGEMERGIFKVFDNNLNLNHHYKYKVLSYTTTGYLSPDSDTIDILWDVAPSSVVNLTGESNDKFVQLKWSAPETLVDGQPLIGLAGYNIYRSKSSRSYSIFPVNKELVTDNYYIDSGLENNIKYFYVIRSVRKVNGTLIEGPPSEEIMLIPNDHVPPQPPRGLVAVPEKEGIILRWDAGTESDLLGYNIYRRQLNEKTWRKLNKEILTTTTFNDNGVKKGLIYFYYVTAVDNSPMKNESDPSQYLKAFLR